jgi:two-component system LytT family response regulator
MITCIIVDDEQYSIETLKEYISKISDVQLIGEFTSSLHAIKTIADGLKPDIIFLDINMPELSGIELGELLSPEIAIIYITGFADYAIKSFETNVYDFLLKPISFQKLLKAINKVTIRKSLQNDKLAATEYLFINPGVKGKMIKIVIADIIYIQGLKNYVIIYLEGAKHITYLTMYEIEQALPPEQFIRIHKSYIINFNMIQSIDGNAVIMTEKLSFPLGGNYKDVLMGMINKYSITSRRKS